MIRTRTRIALAFAMPAIALAGCYVVPVAPDGTVLSYPPAPVAIVPAPAAPVVLNARLYPANEPASLAGVLTGTVTNLMTGRGRLRTELRGEVLVGEATRVQGEAGRGVANAYGPRGTYMSCEYRMSSPSQGIGTCTFSSGEKYSVHLGG
jgi:hypothetical protein